MCARKDSNLHSVNYQILSLARLPIPPQALCECKGRKILANEQVNPDQSEWFLYVVYKLKDFCGNRMDIDVVSLIRGKMYSISYPERLIYPEFYVNLPSKYHDHGH